MIAFLRRFPLLLHLTQKWRLYLHQCDDAVGEFVLDAAAHAAEPWGDPALLHTVNAVLDNVDVEVALAGAARERTLVEGHAIGRDVASHRSAVAREDIARREGDGDDDADGAVVGRVDGAPVVGIEARLAPLAEGVRHALFGGKLRDEFIRRRGEVIVHLPVGGLLLLVYFCGSSGLSDGGGGVRGDLRRDECGEGEECGAAALLLSSVAAWAAEPAAVGATYAENAANAPMTLPLTEEQETELQLADAEKMALLWMRTSAEYRALCYQGYNMALAEIARAQANPAARSGKPLAIVLDCDETVTDNTRAMAESVADGNGRFDALWWRATVHEGRSEALPGAADFLNEVARRGVAIFYVSNRWSEVNYEPTIENLKALGFPSVDAEHVLLMEDRTQSDKQPRFDKIAADYDVVVYMGDNAGDLPLGTKGKSASERSALIDSAKADFGTRYIVFPNPAYGAWVSAMSKEYMTMTPEARDDFYREMLTE